MSGVDVTGQAAYVALIPKSTVVTGQTAYVLIVPGTRVSVTSQTSYLGLFPTLTNKKRRIIMTMTG